MTTRQAHTVARKLFRLCTTNRSLDEQRARDVVGNVVRAGRPGTFRILSRFQRLVRLDLARHTADVKSAVPLSAEVREQLSADVARVYGSGIATSFSEDPTLIGGLCITVGSDVYDGSVTGRLAALEAHF